MGAICGFLGEGDGELLTRMLKLLAHRGTHHVRDISPPSVGLARCEPASHGVTPEGQVAVSADGRVRCVLAGELFNAEDLARRLGSRVATSPRSAAALVAEGFATLGEALFPLLDGAFSLALHDGDVLYLVRDPLGEKPLYYYATPGPDQTLLFASEVKALLADERLVCRPNLKAMYRLMIFSFPPGPETLFEGVLELEPGCLLRCPAKGENRLIPYWRLEERIDDSASEATHVERIDQAVQAAVRRRLPADGGSVAAFLSGGLDSSVVVAHLAEMGVPLTALSVSFGEGHANELLYAKLVADHCGVTHRVLEVRPEDFVQILPKVLWHLDDPYSDCITVPNFLLAREAAECASVVFNGEGGDPILGGPKNKFLILGEWYRYLGHYDLVDAYLSSYHKAYTHMDELFTSAFLSEVGERGSLEALVLPYLEGSQMKSFLNRLFHLNTRLKGGQNILIKVDKMCGAQGLRACSPLFDRTLTELAFTIPPAFKRRGDVEKYVLKKAISSRLPDPIVYRRKAGMGVPLNSWFARGPLREYTTDLLSPERLKERGCFQPTFVADLLSGEVARRTVGRNRTGEILWMLIAVELWHRIYVDGEWEGRI